MENRKEGKAETGGLTRSAARPIGISLFCLSGLSASFANSALFHAVTEWVRATWPFHFASDVSIRFWRPHGIAFWAVYLIVVMGLLALALALAGLISR